MKKICLLIVSIFLFNALCFAEIKTFTKQGESVVQKDQSVNQVISYLKQKLTREAQEEAGTFITTNLKIDNYQITKDEFTSFAGSISKTTVLEETPFMKDKEQYVKVKIKVDIDIDNVKAYLEKIMQDNEYKEQAQKAIKEAEELKKKNLELENKLKTATKQEYEQKLSLQAEQQIQEQKQREIELNKIAVQAKEEYAKIKEEQLQLQQKREQEILKLKEQIAQEKDNVKKAELENQAKIKELELKAKENQQNWNTNTNKISIQQAIKEATTVKQETAEIINKFETLLNENKEKITKSYDEQIQLSCNTNPKDQWETEEEYNTRLEKNKQIEEKLEKEEEETLFEDERKTIESMVITLNPFIEKLQYFQTEKFYDEKGSKAELLSIGEVNIDEQYFVVNIKYNKKKYKLNYDFSKIGKEQAKLMCQTQNQFVIEPMLSVNDKLKQELTAFNVKHLGTKEEKIVDNYIKVKQFNEIIKLNNYESTCLNMKKINQYTTNLIKAIESTKKSNIEHVKNLNNHLKNIKETSKYFKLNNFKQYELFIKAIDKVNTLVIMIATGNSHTVGLKLDGTVIAIGSNKYGQCNVQDWKDIIAISAGDHHTVGLKKDGSVVATGSNLNGTCNVQDWKDIIAISAGNCHTIGLKQNGTVISTNKDSLNGYFNRGQCNVQDWKDIVAISAGDYHTIGLKKDGTVVAVGENKFGECDVSSWKDIKYISAGNTFSAGIKKNGSIITTTDSNSYYHFENKIKKWKNIFNIVIKGLYNNVGLKQDGSVIAIGLNKYGQCNVQNWKDIVAISAGDYHTVGLKKDGTVVAIGLNEDGQCDVQDWNIPIPEFE